HPLMRESLLGQFSNLWIDNLNGDKYRTGKIIPKGLPGEGTTDQSIFTTEQDPRGIQVGTAISTFMKRKGRHGRQNDAAVLAYRDFWGRAAAKRRALLDSLEMEAWPRAKREEAAKRPEGPRRYEKSRPSLPDSFRFAPEVAASGFESWPALEELFVESFQGVNPARGLDGSLVDTDRDALEARMREYFSSVSFAEFRVRHPNLVEKRAEYEPEVVRENLKRVTAFKNSLLLPYHLFPLDARFLYYETEGKLLTRRSPQLYEHLDAGGFLVAVPQSRRASEVRPLFCSTLFDYHLHDRGSFGFPVWLRPSAFPRDLFSEEEPEKAVANLSPTAWAALKETWSLEGDLTGKAARKLTLQLFHLALALGQSPAYHADHEEALLHDWLHLPIPRDRGMLEQATGLGATVSTLLDPLKDPAREIREILGEDAKRLGVLSAHQGDKVSESDLLVEYSFYGAAAGAWRERAPRSPEILNPAWGSSTGDLWINPRVYFRHVPAEVWEFELGGYPVLKKWLGYREAKRRGEKPLTLAEARHLRGMVQRLAALLALGQQLDTAYAAVIEDCFTSRDLGLA
ncbi:MAG TPA: type ISP restriction/modification enzyme, partial [Vicinamibacteria bacterium]|nr:type ISP restriction/modification enzyme [Vicinamibacteria bacterium]